MIYFTELGQYGRLGNQLFQYALVKSVSLKLNLPLELPKFENRVWHGQQCLLPKLNLKYSEQKTNPKFTFTERYPNKFDMEVFNAKEGTNFFGYFQHPSYFLQYKDALMSEFSLKNEQDKTYCKEYLSKFINPTSIHIRLGDYYHNNHCHSNYLILFKEYVSEVISKLPKNTDYLVFTGGSRNGNDDRQSDFELCKKLFSDYNFHYVEQKNELIDLELIKNCKNTIMGWDSTFSWWASFLNKNGTIFCTDKHQVLPLQKLENWIKL